MAVRHRLAAAQTSSEGPTRLRVVEVCGWAALVTGILLATGFFPQGGAATATGWIGGTAMAFGVRAFFGHGKGRITTLGLFNLSLGVFVGYGGFAARTVPSDVSPEYLTVAVSGAFLTQLTIAAVAWNRAAPAADAGVAFAPQSACRRLAWVGFTVFVSLFIAQRALPDLVTGFLVNQTAFTALVLLTVGLLFRADARLVSLRTFIIGVALVIYAGYFFEGTGRLKLVALACALGILVTARFPSRWVKAAIIAVMPAALWWFAADRLRLQESMQAGSSAGRSGLESMLSPITVLGRLLERQAETDYPLNLGREFLSLPFALFPDSLVPEWAPEALGYQLARLSGSPLTSTGYSIASTTMGEWVFNFGLLGFVVAVPVTVWLLTFLDRRFRTAVARADRTPRSLLTLALMSVICGGIADITWSGYHTWGARVLARVPLMIVALAVVPRRHRQAVEPLKAKRETSRLPVSSRPG